MSRDVPFELYKVMEKGYVQAIRSLWPMLQSPRAEGTPDLGAPQISQ